MFMNGRLLLLSCFALTCGTGCNRKSGESQIAINPSQFSKVYTENELNSLIVPGMSIAEVTNTFGLPGSAVKTGEGIILLTYMFPFEAKKEQGPYLTGFGIDIKDGRVVRWSPVTGMTVGTVEGGGSQGSFGELSFQIFLASGSLTNVAAIVDSEGSADASTLRGSPEITFNAKVFAGGSGSERLGEQTVILVVREEDASKLKDLSDGNSGKRLLVVCGNRVIAAPAISAPLASRRLTFTVKSSAVLENLRSQ